LLGVLSGGCRVFTGGLGGSGVGVGLGGRSVGLGVVSEGEGEGEGVGVGLVVRGLCRGVTVGVRRGVGTGSLSDETVGRGLGWGVVGGVEGRHTRIGEDDAAGDAEGEEVRVEEAGTGRSGPLPDGPIKVSDSGVNGPVARITAAATSSVPGRIPAIIRIRLRRPLSSTVSTVESASLTEMIVNGIYPLVRGVV
jgi:hypothetical protein